MTKRVMYMNDGKINNLINLISYRRHDIPTYTVLIDP